MEQNQTGTQVFVSDEFTHKDKASTSMIFGIVSILLCLLPLLSIAGIVFGAVALRKSSDNKRFALEKGLAENGMNTAGYVCGLIGTILSSLMTVIYILALVAAVVFAVNVASGVASGAFNGVFEQIF